MAVGARCVSGIYGRDHAANRYAFGGEHRPRLARAGEKDNGDKSCKSSVLGSHQNRNVSELNLRDVVHDV
jgi:hypothetical protein